MEAKYVVTLNKTLDKILDELEYKDRQVQIVPVSSGGANYTSSLFEITVTNPGKPTLDLFAKVAILNDTLRQQFKGIEERSPYYIEHRVYEELVKNYSEIESKHNVPLEHRYVFPKYYGSNLTLGEEVFIMENLTKKKFHIFGRFNVLDWEHASVSIRDLAKFQALSMALEKEYPEIYEEFKSMELPPMDALENVMKNQLQQAIKQMSPEYQPRLVSFLGKNQDIFKMMMKPVGKCLLVHGDYRTSNILYKRQAGKLISVPVDYQGVRLGNSLMDFHYLMATGSDEKFRKYYYDQLVDLFYSELGLALKRLGLNISQEYPRDQFDADHKMMLSFALLITLTLLPLVLVSEGEAPDIADHKSDVSSFFVKPNDQSKERVEGYMRDFIKWGVI